MGKKYKDIEIGDKFGCWTVIENFEYRISGNKKRKYWKCRCCCENKTIKYIEQTNLIRKNHISCGNLHNVTKSIVKKKIKKYDPINIGDVFNRWTVIDTFKLKKVNNANRRFWKCQCSCEDKTIKYINESNLLSGISTSCGCFRKEIRQTKDLPVLEKSLGILYPETLEIWSNKNDKSPYEFYPKSNKKVFWKCKNNNHKDYIRGIGNSVNSGFRCPNCIRERRESFLQEKVRLYLTNNLNFELNHEYNCSIIPINPKTKQRLPFDNEVILLKLIVEVNGLQHYDTPAYSSIWKPKDMTPDQALKQRKLYDRYKKYIAWKNGYEYLEIPYWTEYNEHYKTLIDEKINEIIKRLEIAS